MQVVLSGWNPVAQDVQNPVEVLHVKQSELQFAHAVVPSEKVPVAHYEQVPLSRPNPALHVRQAPSVLLQVKHPVQLVHED